MDLTTPINNLPKIGTVTTKALHQLHIQTVKDVLFFFPYRYLDFRKTIAINEAHEGEVVTIKAVLKDIQIRRSFRSHMTYCEGVISDETGSMKVVWFNQPYLAKSLQKGESLLLSGKVDRYKILQLVNPVYERLTDESIHTGRLVPVYRASDSIPNRTLRTVIHHCLPLIELLPDTLPNSIRDTYNLVSLPDAIRSLHFPENNDSISAARFRIAFDDILPQQLAVSLLDISMRERKSHVIKTGVSHIKTFLKKLPFTLTAGQKQAVWNILQDMESPGPMNRLLQGDVGSGKTLIALIAMMQTAQNKLQSTLLAPTEILAQQHYKTFCGYLSSSLRIALLTANFASINNQAVSKAELNEAIQTGTVDIVIGTHAIIQKGVAFKNLALAVIDEQHRFGVKQRNFLFTDKANIQPHLLSMSATPIPRTLALAMYGNLTVSTLAEVPSGRKPIITKVIDDAQRNNAYTFIKQRLTAGEQTFIITPRVEDTEKSDVRSAKAEYKLLSETVFSKYSTGLIYGKMKGDEKEVIMNNFEQHAFDILVATSVIEIGIDIPNATVIVIEGAERFGLAQLHQLRGRVCRSDKQSYCFLFTTDPSQQDNERLRLFENSNDGFALAQYDLERRGFGDLLGTQQTGYLFRFPEFITMKALSSARQCAKTMVTEDPKLSSYPELNLIAQDYLDNVHAE